MILSGAHSEAAVINIRLSTPVFPFTRVPLISPACAGVQLFVNHPQVVDYIRGKLAAFLCLQPGLGLTLADVEPLAAEIKRLAGGQLVATLGHLAAGLPIFDVLFQDDGTYTVSVSGG